MSATVWLKSMHPMQFAPSAGPRNRVIFTLETQWWKSAAFARNARTQLGRGRMLSDAEAQLRDRAALEKLKVNPPSGILVQAEGISLAFRGKTAVDRVSIVIHASEI